jgi:D-glycero-D-manno-heptose 1,7-bisphosphate phosphatase
MLLAIVNQINRDVGSPGVTRLQDFDMLPGAAAAVAKIKAAGHWAVLCTNQSAVGKGLLTEPALLAIHAEMAAQIAAAEGSLDHIFFCTEVSTLNL